MKSVRYPILAPDVEIPPWPKVLDEIEAEYDADAPPLRLDRLEASGMLTPRPKRTGLIRGLLAVPIIMGIIWLLLVIGGIE
jgi:hypothetical protein